MNKIAKICKRCGVKKPIADFKLKKNGKRTTCCDRCRAIINKDQNKLKKLSLSPLGKVFNKAKPRMGKDEPYCMRCGKPFLHTIEVKESSTKNISKKAPRKLPLKWERWKGFILCKSCYKDKLKGKKFNLYEEYKDDNGDLKEKHIKDNVGIEDLTKNEKERLYKNYPYERLKECL